MAINIGFGIDHSKTGAYAEGTKTTQRILSQEGIDKIIADVLGGDQGLAALAQGENAAGLSGTTVKSMMAQDLVAKLVGEIANVTAPTVTNSQEQSSQSTTKKSGGLKTVICTELLRQGKLSQELYDAGTSHFLNLHPATVRGYRSWADKIVPRMASNERLSNFFLPIAVARYEHITGIRKNLLGALTVYIGQPVCFVIGHFVPMEVCDNGYSNT